MIIHADGVPFYCWRKTKQQPTWRGVRCLKDLVDAWMYQEAIWRLRPDWIVETGTCYGGSALMFADFCAIAGNGRVISIDISPMGTPEHDKVTYIKGSSIDPGVVEEVKGLIGKDKVMVVLDSDHSYYHVKREMEIYSDLVTPSSILVVEDANTMTSVWQAIEDFSDARFAPLKQPVAVAATWFIRAEI